MRRRSLLSPLAVAVCVAACGSPEESSAGSGQSTAAGGDAPPVFDLAEHALDAVAVPVAARTAASA